MAYRRSKSKSKSRSRRPLAKGRSTRARAKIVKGYTRKTGMYGRFGPTRNKPEAKFFDTRACVPSGESVGAVLFDSLTDGSAPSWGVIAPYPMAAQRCDYPSRAISHILEIGQGNEVSQRVGRKVFLKSVQFHLTLARQGGEKNAIRVHVWTVHDTQYNGGDAAGASAPTSIWQPSTIPAAGTVFANNVWFDSFPNLANSGRFKILKHKKIDLTVANNDEGNTFARAQQLKEVIWTITPKIALEWAAGDTTGALSNLRTNAIFVYTSVEWADPSNASGLASAISVAASLRTRARFTDL